MPVYTNPFNPQTDIGQGLQNIAIAMFGGPTPGDMEDRAALRSQRASHAKLYDLQAAKLMRDADEAHARAAMRSPDAINEMVALRTGVPVPAIKNALTYLRGESSQAGTMPPPGDSVSRIGNTMFSTRAGMMDNTVNADEIQKAISTGAAQLEREGIIGGTVDPTAVTQAHFATSGKAPFDNLGTAGTFNAVTGGGQTLNPTGNANVGAANALAGARAAMARNNDAQAAVHDLERRSGVRVGAPVIVNDPEVGPMYTAPSSAIGRQAVKIEAPSTAALNASRATLADARSGLADAQTGLTDARTGRIEEGTDTQLVPVIDDETGQVVYAPRTEAVGSRPGAVPRVFAPPRTPQPVSLNKPQMEAMAAAFTALAGGSSLAPDLATNLTAQATALATNPSSPYFRNPMGAAQQVWQQSQSSIVRPPAWKLWNQQITSAPRGPQPAAPAVASAAPGAPGGGTPPQRVQPTIQPAPMVASQRVKGQVYQTPRGPLKWTGSGWVAPDA